VQPYYQDALTTLQQGDCRALLAQLPEASVHCVVTSPPYWGLRDYSLPPSVWDGDPACQHEWGGDIPHESRHRYTAENSGKEGVVAGTKGYPQGRGTVCTRCHAWRGCLGLEPTPDAFVQHLVAIFRAVWRVLRDDGTLWLNLGDAYAGSSMSGGVGAGTIVGSQHGARKGRDLRFPAPPRGRRDLPAKNLLGLPWRVAFALQADGWYLRSDIIWHKPNPMPESVRDRPTKSHEYLFLLTKRPKYFYDAEAVREPAAYGRREWKGQHYKNGDRRIHHLGTTVGGNPAAGRNRRSVWTIATQPYKGAHFATFPPRLIEPCVLAGTSAAGCCTQCGAPLRRVIACTPDYSRGEGRTPKTNHQGGRSHFRTNPPSSRHTTLGWRRTCRHDGPLEPCTVLDPFAGAGTTLLVAKRHGRHGLGIDLNPTYCVLAAARLAATRVEEAA
jgi:DNA modification methylase